MTVTPADCRNTLYSSRVWALASATRIVRPRSASRAADGSATQRSACSPSARSGWTATESVCDRIREASHCSVVRDIGENPNERTPHGGHKGDKGQQGKTKNSPCELLLHGVDQEVIQRSASLAISGGSSCRPSNSRYVTS